MADYQILFQKADTIASGSALAPGTTQFLLTSGNFGTHTDYYVIDYDVPALAEVIELSVNGTTATVISRGRDGTAQQTHGQGAKIGSMWTTSHQILLTSGQGIWQPYTPTWRTNGGTQPSLGNGQLVGRYNVIGKTITALAELSCGSTTTFGAGDFIFGLPITPANNGFDYIGSARATHTNFSNYNFSTDASHSLGGMNIWTVAGSLIGSGIPFQWAVNDGMAMQVTYEID